MTKGSEADAPVVGIEPAGATRNPGAPGVDPPSIPSVNLRLVRGEADRCGFWVTMTRYGDRQPLTLMDTPDISTLVSDAILHGVTELKPVMLTDTRRDPPRYVYLVHRPGKEPLEREDWLYRIVEAIEAWAPEAAGLYLSPELLEPAVAARLMQDLIELCVKRTRVRNFFLYTGTWGINQLLNAALTIKNSMTTSEQPVHVYH